MNSGATPIPVRGDKKRKMDDGISSVIFGVQTGSSQHTRIFNLQVLLFLIDRYWPTIHHALKLHIVEALLQSVTSEDATIQTWAFLSLGATVFAERFLATAKGVLPSSSQSPQSQSQVGYETTTWDSIWTHSIRRVNAPATCRAASHAAYIVIFQATGGLAISLPSQRVLSEIETLASDLEVQGPAFLYDSVCNFLSQCIRLATQDARLYRIHLEDKVIGWMVDHWKVAGDVKAKVVPQNLQDVLNLLVVVCGLPRRSFLVSRSFLPSCAITSTVEKESLEKNIRDFLLSAKLPSFQGTTTRGLDDISPSPIAEVNVSTSSVDSLPPQPRERKISGFFLRNLETLTTEWEGIAENHTNVTADIARQSLEQALMPLVFESLLAYNSIAVNRHVIQAATKLISTIVSLLHGTTWNSIEKATVLYALEPLINLEDDEVLDTPKWETLLPPGVSSGIKKRVFHNLVDNTGDVLNPSQARRTNLLRIIWQLPDVSVDVDPRGPMLIVISRLRIAFRTP